MRTKWRPPLVGAAAELRRLHAENEALRHQKLQAVTDQADQMTMDEALLRQALHALQLIDAAMPFTVAKQTIAAIKERLK